MSKITPDSLERSSEPKRATWVTLLGVLLGGAALGLVGGFLQAVEVTIGSISVPFWMVIVLAAMLTTARAITINYGSRKPAIAWFVGWLAVTLLLSTPLPSGDQVISAGVVQMVYVFGGAVLGAMFVSLPPNLRPEVEPVDASDADGLTTSPDANPQATA